MDAIESVGIGQLVGVAGPGSGRGALRASSETEGGTSFSEILVKALGEVSDAQNQAQEAIGAFVRGDPIEVHEVMAAAAEAGIALEMLIEIRNKITEAYRAVIQMQT